MSLCWKANVRPLQVSADTVASMLISEMVITTAGDIEEQRGLNGSDGFLLLPKLRLAGQAEIDPALEGFHVVPKKGAGFVIDELPVTKELRRLGDISFRLLKNGNIQKHQ